MGGSSKRRGRSERRAHIRFPTTLEVRYTTSGRQGRGHTIDLSSSGLRFRADKPLLTGQSIAVYIDWPILLEGDVKLQLVLSGVVVRTDGTEVAVQIHQQVMKPGSGGQRSP